VLKNSYVSNFTGFQQFNTYSAFYTIRYKGNIFSCFFLQTLSSHCDHGLGFFLFVCFDKKTNQVKVTVLRIHQFDLQPSQSVVFAFSKPDTVHVDIKV